MAEQHTRDILDLQTKIRSRLLEFGYADDVSAGRISRHLAEIAVLGKAFHESTAPLFLSLDADNLSAWLRLVISIKCDLEELQDALTDVGADLENLIEFFQHRQP